MVIICEKIIKDNKNFKIEIQKILGIGKFRSQLLCSSLGLPKSFKFDNKLNINNYQLLNNDLLFILDKVNNFIVENNLKYIKNIDLKNLKEVHNYKAIRHMQGLPVNGQRTHTNAKTQKKKQRNK